MRTNSNKNIKIFVIGAIVIALWILAFYLYTTYSKIEIGGENYTAIKTRFHI